MIKKTITIKYQDKPVFVTDVRDMEIGSFIEAKAQAEENLAAILSAYEADKEELRALKREVESMKADIAFLKGE